MSVFKYILKWCCSSSNENEEEKIQNTNKKDNCHIKNPSEDTFIQGHCPYEEGSIIAAPSPKMDGSSTDLPKLQIRITESSVIPVGTILNINPIGLENSKRNKGDFKTFIGSKLMDNGEVLNDFVIEESSKGMGRQHLAIKFNTSIQKYSIADLGDGSGTFVRIDSALVLKDGYIISFGNSHMTIHFNSIAKTLTIKFLEGPKCNEVYNLNPSDETVLVGRMVDCRIRFDDNSMSRYQCSISYEESKGWILIDGMGDKKSTNGTWLFVEEDHEIFDGLVFKAGKTLFEVHIVKT